ncbi:DUF2087 domain-containing protein [Leuconostoc pseudomesenteroides]|uniref:DUF2087 domain-containing protein n=1 Tax=Leuconostoc pseudomesenteroides TaxID=33968 RepID=UPI0021A3788C|nr:DUF2087 domain-containing protein [Leuconostoc pseudomesenteroides]MCT4413531.1 DUF2087 domain-containing protein [Leuconostoc pseudomesenteroides]
MAKGIEQFLDENGVLISWPAKYTKKVQIMEYLSTKFEKNIVYDEQDVNSILRKWSNYSDYPMLRRFLVDLGFLNRDRYGKEYLLTAKKETNN